jgi:hypothetical protein
LPPSRPTRPLHRSRRRWAPTCPRSRSAASCAACSSTRTARDSSTPDAATSRPRGCGGRRRRSPPRTSGTTSNPVSSTQDHDRRASSSPHRGRWRRRPRCVARAAGAGGRSRRADAGLARPRLRLPPAAVAEPFALGDPRRTPLAQAALSVNARFVRAMVTAVDDAERRVLLGDGRTLAYDALLADRRTSRLRRRRRAGHPPSSRAARRLDLADELDARDPERIADRTCGLGTGDHQLAAVRAVQTLRATAARPSAIRARARSLAGSELRANSAASAPTARACATAAAAWSITRPLAGPPPASASESTSTGTARNTDGSAESCASIDRSQAHGLSSSR